MTATLPQPGGTRLVLVLGSSRVTYADSGAPDLAALVADAMQRGTGVGWRCASELLFPTASMAERAGRLVARHDPDAVVLDLPGFAYMYQSVVTRIRKRWPRLYPGANALMSRLQALSGGGNDGGDSLRGWIFRAPRRLALTVLGAESEISPEEAIAYFTATLETLLRREDLTIICRLPTNTWQMPRAIREEAERRLVVVRRAVTDYCDQHHIPYYDLFQGLADRGLSWGFAEDRIHKDRRTTQVDIEMMTECLAAALDLDPGTARTSPTARRPADAARRPPGV